MTKKELAIANHDKKFNCAQAVACAFAKEDSDEIDDSDIPLDPVMEDEEAPAPKKNRKKQKK